MLRPNFPPVVARQTAVTDVQISAVNGTAFVNNLQAFTANNPDYWKLLASDSVTQANSKISAVAGTAFYGFGSGTNLTANLGKYLVVKDSTGKAITGWIKAAGSGITYGEEKNTNHDFSAWTGDDPDGWAVANENATRYVTEDVNGARFYSLDYTPMLGLEATTSAWSVGALGAFVFNIHSITSGSMKTNGTGFGGTTTVNQVGTTTFYRTVTDTSTVANVYRQVAPTDLVISSISFKQVLTPSATGVTITSTKNGTTYDWESQETGFNYNDVSGYTYQVYDRDLSAFCDNEHSISFYDIYGNCIEGVLKEVGVLETVGSELIANVYNRPVSANYDTLTINANGKDIDSAIATSDSYAYTEEMTSVLFSLIKIDLDITLNSGAAPILYSRRNTTASNAGIVNVVDGTFYWTMRYHVPPLSNPDTGLALRNPSAGNWSLVWSAKKVLTPSPNGAVIVNAKGGTTQNFRRVDSGFAFNQANYDIVIRKHKKLFPFNIPDEEVHELWKLYSLGGGASWTNKTGWFTDLDVENWYGITLSGGRVQEIVIPSNNGVGNISSFKPSVFTNMDRLYLYSNQFTGDLSGWVLPSNMTNLHLSSNQFTGDLSGWVLPSNMTALYLHTSQFTGDLSGWVLPANMTALYLHTSQFTGAPDISINTTMRSYLCHSNGLLTATVDAIIEGIWARRMAFTYTTPIILEIGGTNQAATGIEQNVCPPTTPKEKIYQLENDGCSEGFKKWTITNN